MTAPTETVELPKLPEGFTVQMTPDPNASPAVIYFEQDMQDYARAAVLADRASRSPVVGAVGGEPLTEEQALAAARKALDGPDATDEDYGPNTLNMVWFRTICLPIVRAVEAFHGIGVSPTEGR